MVIEVPTLGVQIKVHQCCCVLIPHRVYKSAVERHDPDVLAGNQCREMVEGNDNPFCASCEDRHPDVDERERVLAVITNG